MGIVIDTSIFVAAERGRFDAKRFFHNECAAESVFVTTITISELLHGWERAPIGKRKNERKRHIEDIIHQYVLLDFDLETARHHASLWALLQATGQMINAHDIIIAASCLAYNHDVATLNLKDFVRIPQLTLRDVGSYKIPQE